MAMNAPPNGGGLPRGELLGRYRTYEDAQKVVDHLAAAEGFEVKNLTIVGNDLRSVERIRSRLTYPKVAGAGAAQGAMFGVFIGLLMMLFTPEAPLLNLALAVVLGMAVWMIIGVVGFSVRRGKREFASTSQLVATTYDVVCDFSVAGRARQLVTGSGVQSLNRWNDPTGRGPGPTAAGGGPQPHPPVQQGAGHAGPEHPAAARGDGSARPDAADQGADHLDDGQRSSGQLGAEDAGVQGADAGAEETGPSTSSPTGYESLPDGRPRYGVRLSDLHGSGEAGNAARGTPEGTAVSPQPAGSQDSGEQQEPAARPPEDHER